MLNLSRHRRFRWPTPLLPIVFNSTVPSPVASVTVRNFIPLFFWGVAGFFLCGCAMMTYFGIIGEIPEGEADWKFWSAAAFFWAGGLFVGGVVFRIPLTVLKIAPQRIDFTHYWPLRKQVSSFTHADIADFRLLETTDSDGDPYFKALMITRSGQEHTIAEGHSREAIDAIVSKCQNALLRA